MDITNQGLFTPDEAAAFMNVHVSTIYRYMERETDPLPSYKISRNNIRIDKNELILWVKAHGKE